MLCSVRTRFPPSPTGFLHIGGLRTALFSYLLAKKKGGTFYVRIEDTDQSREVAGATLNILQTLHWAGIGPDEGVTLSSFDSAQDDTTIVERGKFGPYFQSKRLPIYQEHGEKLLATGAAYRCFCSQERLEAMRKEQEARHQAPMYDRTCLRIPNEEAEKRSKEERHVIRMKIPSEKEIVCKDHIRGEVRFSLATLDDQVLMKSDGFPTYHLAHVVDDHLMETTLVVRGEEWLPSLPKHILLFRAFGWDPPEYAHVPLLLAKGGGKLSKRQGDVSVEAFREKGYLPEAVLNFIALLGWNPGTSRPAGSGAGQRPEKEQEIFSLPELIERFDLSRVQKAGAIFDTQKLDWLQGQWMRGFKLEEFVRRIRPNVEQKFSAAKEDKDFQKKAELIQKRITFFSEAPEMLRFFYEEPTPSLELLANEKQGVRKEDLSDILKLLLKILNDIEKWDYVQIRDHINASHLEDTVTELEEGKSKVLRCGRLTTRQLLWVLRAALTGLPYSPGALEVAEILQMEKTIERLKRCQDML